MSEELQGRVRRYEYELVGWGSKYLSRDDWKWRDPEYDTLEDAIEEMAAGGWRFVESVDKTAVFERPIAQEDSA